MEFRIGIVDETPQQPSSAQPAAQQPTSQPAQHSAAQQPSVPIPQLQSIQQTLLPAIASAAPQMARNLYAEATESSASASQPLSESDTAELRKQFPWLSEQILAAAKEQMPIAMAPATTPGQSESPAEGMVRFYRGGNIEPGGQASSRELTQSLYEAVQQALSKGGVVHFVDVPETHPQMGEIGPLVADEELAKQLRPYEDANAAQKFGAAAGEAFAGKIQPIVEQMKLAAEDEFEIIPARDENEFELQQEMPWGKTAREEFAKRRKAMADYAREGVVDEILPAVEKTAPEALPQSSPSPPSSPSPFDPVKAAQQRLDNIRRQVATDEAYAKLTNDEPPVYDVIDTEKEKRQRELAPLQRQLNSGARIAAQAGLGTAGQALGGAADLAVGLGTGNIIQAAIGGMEVLTAASHMTAQAFDQTRRSVKFVGDEFSAVAHNDYMGAFNKAVDFAAGSLEKIPIVGEALSAGLEAAAQPLRSFEQAVDSFVQRGRELAHFSPELAYAGANADIRSLLADIHEANELGADLARLTDAQSKFNTELREIFLPIKKDVAELLATLMEFSSDSLVILRNLVLIMTAGTNATKVLAPAVAASESALVSISGLAVAAFAFLRGQKDKEKGDADLLSGLFKTLPPVDNTQTVNEPDKGVQDVNSEFSF